MLKLSVGSFIVPWLFEPCKCGTQTPTRQSTVREVSNSLPTRHRRDIYLLISGNKLNVVYYGSHSGEC